MESFLIAARAVHYASSISLAGVFAFISFVAIPEISPRLGQRLSMLAWASLVLAVLSGGAWLVFVAAQMSGQPVAATVSQGLVAIVLQRTRFGQVWMVRAVLAVILAALLSLPRGWRGRLWNWGGLAFAAGLLASLAWAGHGGATPGRPGDLHLAADMLHLLAAGAWVGSLIPLALFLAGAWQNADPGARTLRRVVTRYSVLAATSVGVLFAGGLANTWFLAGSTPALIGTDYGRLLLAKVAIFVTMVTIGSVNLLRMLPRLAPTAAEGAPRQRAALSHLRRNALVEAGLGLAVLGIVAVLGILPPGLHTEPGWPLPFRLELAALEPAAIAALAIFAALAVICAIIGVATAAAGRYRAMAAAWASLIICVAAGVFTARPAIAPAYPTSFYAPAEPYSAPSVAQGARLYTESCAVCHGANGKGDGPAAQVSPIRPADLTAPHLFAHTPGDLFWWVSHGKANGAMPGFAAVMSPADRWDVINFVRARAAGVLSQKLGPEIATTAAPAVPDFAFETQNGQQTLHRLLRNGPVLLVLCEAPPSAARLAQLDAVQRGSGAAPLRVIVVDLAAQAMSRAETAPSPPPVAISPDVTATLKLFRTPADGPETDLMLDRAGNVRARWATGKGGVPDAETLAKDAYMAAQIPASPENHAGHIH
ncbi:MAG: copper homeostasis membrane protein CopD [Alphaproteobacteria bacterium]|nr:copper homeostasis membrane protein CopD [Alphaproteobacteria bacterium]